MALVVDSSFLVALLVREDHSAFAAASLNRLADQPREAPDLIVWEVANVLWRKTRKGDLLGDERREMLGAFWDFQIALEAPSASSTLVLVAYADHHDLTAYDAAYLELAIRREAPLATLDKALTRAARAEGLTVHSPF